MLTIHFLLTLFTKCGHIVPAADFFCLLWEHQGSWESEIFREFLNTKTGKQWRQSIHASVKKVSLIDYFFEILRFWGRTLFAPAHGYTSQKKYMVNKVKLINDNMYDGSSCPEAFRKIGVLENFAKFAGKHLCQCLFFNKL